MDVEEYLVTPSRVFLVTWPTGFSVEGDDSTMSSSFQSQVTLKLEAYNHNSVSKLALNLQIERKISAGTLKWCEWRVGPL